MKRTTRMLMTAFAAVTIAAVSSAREVRVDSSLPSYDKSQNVSGSLRLSASATNMELARAMVDAFKDAQPNVSVQVSAGRGGEVSLGVDNVGDVNLRIATEAIAVYVNKDNPLQGLTRDQVKDIFTADGRVDRWSVLGVSGTMAEKPIERHGPNTDSDEHRLLGDLLGARISSEVRREPGSAAVVNGVGAEPSAIGFTGVEFGTKRTRTVSIASASGGSFVAPTAANCANGSYPLSRSVTLGLGSSASPAAREFARFALSREGQQAITGAGRVPVSASAASTERSKIK